MKSFLMLMITALLSFQSMATPAISDKVLTIALGSAPDAGFDPIFGWGKYNRPLFQSTLLKRNKNLEFVGDLATQWTLDDSKLNWHVQLRQDVKFSDGSSLSAIDVKFSFEQAQNQASQHDLTNLAHVEIINEHELRFQLKKPDIIFIDHFADLAIVPKKLYSAQYASHPVGSGPFKFIRWDRNQQLIMQPNPYYYGNKPQFKQVIVIFSTEEGHYSRLRAGQLDLATIAPRYARQLPPNYRLWRIDSVDNRGIAWPMLAVQNDSKGNDVSSDLSIRQAIDLVIDRQVLASQLLDGFATPAYSIADNLPWGLPSPTQLPQVNLEAAKALLDQNGWQLHNGIRQRAGVQASMELYYFAGDSVRQQLALAVAQMVKPLGIHITPIGKSWEYINTKMHRQPVLFGFGSHSATEVRAVHHSKFAGQGYFNSGYYNNPLVDKTLDDAQHAPDWETSLIDWQKAQQLIAQDLPWSWLVNLQHLYAANTCLDLNNPSIEPHEHGWPLANNIEEWRWVCSR